MRDPSRNTGMERILVFQHTRNEPLGFIEHLLTEWSLPFEYVRLWETNEIPETEASHLIVLGGPMSVNDEEEFPFLALEKARIRKNAQQNIPILGLCLGAQLIASAHGARVYRHVQETGWLPVCSFPCDGSDPALFPERFMVFQFHEDTFDIPYGGQLLCIGEQVRNQAFRYRNALALQFHPEMTPDLIGAWCRDLRSEKQEKILQDSKQNLPDCNHLCRNLLQRFMSLRQ